MNLGRVVRNIGAGYTGAAVNGLTLLVLTPLVIRRLGPVEYGLWVLAAAIGGTLGFLNAGSGAAATRSAASLAGTGRWAEASHEIGSVFRIYLGVGAAAAAGLAAVSFTSMERFHIPPESASTARTLLLLIAVNFLISFPFGVTRSVLAGLHRFPLLNGIEVAATGFRLAASAAALSLGFGLVGLGVVQLASSIAGHLARWLAIRRIAPALRLAGGPDFPGLAPGVSRFSFLSFGYESLRTLFDNADLLLLGFLAGPETVGPFAVALTLASFVLKGLQPIAGVLFPMASLEDALGQRDRTARMLEVGTRVKLALAMPVVSLLIVDGRPLIRLWTGEDFVGVAPVIATLALVSLAGAASLTATTLLFGAGRMRPLLLAEGVRYGLNLVLVLAGFRLFGPVGVAAATLIAVAGVDLFLMLRRACPWTGVEPRSFLLHSVAPPILAGIPILLGLALWRHFDPDPAPPMLLARAAAGLGGFGLTYALSRTFREERRLMGRAWAEGLR